MAFPAGGRRRAPDGPCRRRSRLRGRPSDAVDAWYEEDEGFFGHPRNPYHRIDCLRSSRSLRVEAAGTVLVDTTDTMVVYETALDPRLYVDPALVRVELTRSQLHTYCPYKGTATYWNAVVDGVVLPDVAWSYEDALPESSPLQHLVSFDDQKRVGVPRPAAAPTDANRMGDMRSLVWVRGRPGHRARTVKGMSHGT